MENENQSENFLQVPKVRKSAAIIQELKNKNYSHYLSPILSSRATSTAKKTGHECLTGLPAHYFEKKMERNDTHDSSLGILDIDDCLNDDLKKTNLSKSLNNIPSLPFNPQEISARSTNEYMRKDNNKENTDPNPTKNKPKSSYDNTMNDVRALIEKAKIQSKFTDELMNSTNYNDENFKMSLQSFKDSQKTDINISNVWKLSLQSSKLSNFPCGEKESSIRESMFGSKINMSEEELECIKEHGDLPIPMHLLNDTKILENTATSINPMSDSKISIGNYFVQRSEKHHILQARSPEKHPGYPLLSDIDFIGQNDASNQKNSIDIDPNNMQSKSATFNICTNLRQDNLTHASCSSNNDDTLTNSFLSLTQIKNFVGKMDTESPSSLLEHMLKEKSKRKMEEKLSRTKTLSNPVDNTDNNILSSNENQALLPESNFSHKTKEIINSSFNITQNTNEYPIKENKNFASCYNIPDLFNSKNTNSMSTSRAFSKSSGSNTTNNTVKSSNLSLLRKSPVENIDRELESKLKNAMDLNDSILSINRKQLRQMNPVDTSPGLLSVSSDKNYQISFASDVSKEIKELMSPLSVNNPDISLKTPNSGRYVKKLLDHFPESKDCVNDKEGWISPSRSQIHNVSKECIPSDTPIKETNISNIKNTNAEIVELNNEGDWVKITSLEQNIMIGVSQDLHISIESLGSRWLSMNITIENIFIDNELYSGNVSNVITVQGSATNILLTAKSKIGFNLNVVTWLCDETIDVNLKIELLDIVTKCTCVVNHLVRMNTYLPRISVQTFDMRTIDRIEFPLIPKNCETCTAFVVFNDSKMDIPIKLAINNTIADVFELTNIEIVSEREKDEKLSFYSKPQSISNVCNPTVSNNIFILPKNKNTPLISFIKFNAPNIDCDEIQLISGTLEIFLIPLLKSDFNLCLKKMPITGGFGTCTLLLRNKKKSDVVNIYQGSSENIEIYNVGTLPMQYKIFIGMHDERNSSSATSVSVTPCKQDIFVLDRSEILLKANEKSFIKITFPHSETFGNVRRLLVFENPYSTDFFDIVGVINAPRSQSQQSTYSVESASTQSQECVLKSTKKELSWGAVKLGVSKIQDITLKNVSITKKIRVIATVIGEGFKIVSDNASESFFTFTLQPQECRAINLEFKAASLGGHVGVLKIFKRCSSNYQSDNSVEPKLLFKAPLYGVCGQSKLVFRDGVFRHAGAQGLPLGPLNDSGFNKQIFFTIWNKGTTRGFALFNIDLKWKYRTLGDDVFVTPSKVIIEPEECIKCAVNVPRKTILQLTKGRIGETEAIGTLNILHGDESTRLRIKRICSNHRKDDTLLEEWNNKCQDKLKALCSNFQNEDVCYAKTNNFMESPTTLWNLLDDLQQIDVTITYDLDLDNSATRLSSDLDDTLHFHTINEDSLNKTLIFDPKNEQN